MKWITQYAPPLMFALFVILATAISAVALPILIIPLLAVLAVALTMICLDRR